MNTANIEWCGNIDCPWNCFTLCEAAFGTCSNVKELELIVDAECEE